MPSILQIQDIRKAFGPRVIFDSANATLTTDQKVGFIGRNGAGKSTLCKMMIGEQPPDAGRIIPSGDLRLSYLEQHDPFRDGETVLDFLERHSDQEAWKCGEVAAKFQIKGALLEAEVTQLSGGYQTRVKLIAMLLREPNFLILDEPSNYLDLKTLILLEEFLQDFRGGFLLVSHDREFLKKTCDHTLEAADGQLTLYPGSVEDYLAFKHEQYALAVRTNATIETKRKQLQQFVDRFRAKASKASQARSKMKQIEKMQLVDIAETHATVHIRIPSIQPRQGAAFRCHKLAIGYPDTIVADEIEMEFEHGARIAIVGDNGQGKTTFMRTIAEDLPVKDGTFRWGYQCTAAYYAQHVVASLDGSLTVLEHLANHAASGITRQDVLAMAGSFLFKGDDVKKRIAVLSGGECARLCLAGLLLMQRSVLLLDEPTNHLDFETVEALGAALQQFQGTIFFISHDRTFVHMVATQIADVKDGAIVRYPGTYAEYVYRLETQVHNELTTGHSSAPQQAKRRDTAPAPSTTVSGKPPSKLSRRQLTKAIKHSEAQQHTYHAEKKALEARLAANPTGWTRADADRLDTLTRQLHEEEHTWIQLTEALEARRNS